MAEHAGITAYQVRKIWKAADLQPHRRLCRQSNRHRWFLYEPACHPGREPKDNPRFVVTNLKNKSAFIYQRVYCQRAPIENRIKELLYGFNIDRTSFTRFFANQFRGLLTLCAYVLFQELRLKARGTELANAQVTTLQERLLKLAVWVKQSTRRIKLQLPDSAPWRQERSLIVCAVRRVSHINLLFFDETRD